MSTPNALQQHGGRTNGLPNEAGPWLHSAQHQRARVCDPLPTLPTLVSRESGEFNPYLESRRTLVHLGEG